MIRGVEVLRLGSIEMPTESESPVWRAPTFARNKYSVGPSQDDSRSPAQVSREEGDVGPVSRYTAIDSLRSAVRAYVGGLESDASEPMGFSILGGPAVAFS